MKVTLRKRILPLATAAFCSLTWSVSAQTTATVTVNAAPVSAVVPPEGYRVDTAVYDSDLTASGVAPALHAADVTV